MSTVSIRGLEKRFGDFAAVKHLDLEVSQGEFVTLLGPSGCGKTTTLRCVAGLEHLSAGQIAIGDRVVADGAKRAAVPPEKRDLGMVFQSYALWPHMTVEGNVAYPLRRQGVAREQVRTRVGQMVELVGLGAKLHSPVSELSGGQQQRVALARALVKGPQVLLCDEPLSNLDASLRRQVRNEIRRLHDETGTTCLYVTHDQEEAVALADRIVVMFDGEMTQVGTPREIFSRPRTEFIAKFVGMQNVLEVKESSRSSAGLDLSLVLGTTLRAAPGLAESGEVVGCAFRAEDVQLAAPSHTGPNVIEGEVVSSFFVGSYTEVVFTRGGQRLGARLLERDLNGAHRPEVGEQHRFVVDPASVVPLFPA